VRATGAELELSNVGITGPSWSCPPRAPGRAGAVQRAHTLRGRAGAVRRTRAPPDRAGAVRRTCARHRGRADAATIAAVLSHATGPCWSCPTWARPTGPSWTRRRWLPSWRTPPGRAGAVRRARPGPCWTRRRWLPSWLAPLGRAGAVRRARDRPELDAATLP
jgi:hypothetical protein